MKCESCSFEINPKWHHALRQNICPACGKSILPEHLKNLLVTLSETMENMKDYTSQLDDWMLANYNYIKTDSPDISKYIPKQMLDELKKVEMDKDFQSRKDSNSNKFTVKIKTENGEEDVEVEPLQSEEATNEFFKRAEVIKKNPNATHKSPAEKTEYLKKMAQQIKRVGSQGLSDASGNSITLSPEMLENADPEAIEDYQQMISGDNVQSSLDYDSDDVPDFVLAANLAAAGGKSNSGDVNAKDLAALQRLQSKTSQARKNMATGSMGSFSRS